MKLYIGLQYIKDICQGWHKKVQDLFPLWSLMAYTSSEEEVLLHFLVTEPAVVGSYPTTALSRGLSPLSAVFPRRHMVFP